MHTFTTPAPITAVLDIPAGRVQLIAADRADTTVEVTPANTTKNRDLKAAEQTTVDYTDGVLRIQTTTKNQYLGPSGSIEVTIKLPTGSNIEAKTASTELRTVGRLGEITFEGAHRQIKLDETTNLNLTAVDGDIEIGRLGGPAQISTARGDITITEATTGELLLNTHSGDITIGAATGISATLNAATPHGRITNTLKNDGTPNLNIHATTTDGDITAHSL
jgi:DUF4097 and DUF4098 domain-containing protein YvlB